METTQKPREETFRIHDPEEKRRHVRREVPSGEQFGRSAVKTEQPRRGSSETKKRKPEKAAAPRKAAPKKPTEEKAAPKKTGTIPFNAGSYQASTAKVKEPYTHRCTVCGRTDVTNPELEFRYCSRCNGYYCYCEEHISNHAHIQ